MEEKLNSIDNKRHKSIYQISQWYRIFCLTLLFLTIGLFCSLPLQAAELTAPEAKSTINKILKSADYQREFPEPNSKPKPEPKTPETAPKETDREEEKSELKIEEPAQPLKKPTKETTKLVRYFVIAIAAMILMIFVYHLIKEFPALRRATRRRKNDEVAEEVEVQPEPAPVHVKLSKLDEADEIAAKGNYTEAIRHLLLHSFDILRQHSGTNFTQSMTNREVLSQAPVDGSVKQALKTIVAAEEISHFGGRVPNQQIFRKCQVSFSEFAGKMNEAGS